MKPNIIPKLNILMLLTLRYDADRLIYPEIGICSYLANFGHEVTWIMSSVGAGEIKRFYIDNVSAFAVPYVRYLGESNIMAKMFNKLADAMRRMRAIKRIFREGRYSLIWVRDDIFDGLTAVYLKKKYGVPFAFNLSDPLGQEWETYKIEAKKPKILYYVITRLSALIKVYILKRADSILLTTKWFEEGLINKGIPGLKLMHYPNGVDAVSFAGKGEKDIKDKYDLNGTRAIIYVGTMDKARYLGMLIKAFAIVRKGGEKVKLLMVGDGTDKPNLERLAAEFGIGDEVIFTGQVPQAEVPHFIAAAEIGVSPVPPLPFYKVTCPVKMLEYMAMAKPVVANEEIFEHKEVLGQSQGGVTVPYTAGAFADAIIELLDNPERAVKMGCRGRDWVVKNRSYEVLARRLEEGCLSLLTG